MAFFSDTCALTFRKCAAELGIIVRKLLDKNQLLWSHSSVLLKNKSIKNVELVGSFTSKRTIVVHFFSETVQ